MNYYPGRPMRRVRCYVCCLPIPLMASAVLVLLAAVLRRRPGPSSAGR